MHLNPGDEPNSLKAESTDMFQAHSEYLPDLLCMPSHFASLYRPILSGEYLKLLCINLPPSCFSDKCNFIVFETLLLF